MSRRPPRRPHARALVDHSVAVGQLIDAYAAAASGGPWPTPAEIESGYGGSRVRPHLTGGLVIDGDDEWAGRYSPQLAALGPHGDRRLDQVVGPNWAVVGRDDPAELMSPVTAQFWDGLGAKVLCLGADVGPMGTILDRHHAAVIRPDRYICAVTSEANDLDTLTDHIRTRGALTPVPA